MSGNSEENRQLGTQPLDEILNKLGLANSDLVEVSTDQLTHKQVQKCRKGRKVTKNIQNKVLKALNRRSDSSYVHNDLFNYEGA